MCKQWNKARKEETAISCLLSFASKIQLTSYPPTSSVECSSKKMHKVDGDELQFSFVLYTLYMARKNSVKFYAQFKHSYPEVISECLR